MYFWIVAIDDSWFKYDSLEMQQTDWLSGQPVHPGRGLAADWHLAKRFEDQHYLAESSFFMVTSQREASFCWLKIIEISICKGCNQPIPSHWFIGPTLGGDRLLATGSVMSILSGHKSWIPETCLRSCRTRNKNSLRWSREELCGPKVYRPKQNQIQSPVL